MNSIYLIGRAGNAGELRYTQNGHPVFNVSIATHDQFKDQETTTWHKIVVFGKVAERMAPLIEKGSEVFISGRISNREYVDKTGAKRTSTEVIAQFMRVLSKMNGEESESQSKVDLDIPF